MGSRVQCEARVLQFWTLKYVDPATYQILGNLKIVTTGVLFRLLLRRRLSTLQWIALALLMIGATTSQVARPLSRSFLPQPPTKPPSHKALSAVALPQIPKYARALIE